VRWFKNGGEGGIRTLGTDLSPYNFLAGSRFQPLSHLSKENQRITIKNVPLPFKLKK
jgi:hypothetical protein